MRIMTDRLDLRPDMKVLEVGFGNGTLAAHMIKDHQVHVT
jgi:cyclopropane fatty-acyl-phospholipid synthase-like methyltransferase